MTNPQITATERERFFLTPREWKTVAQVIAVIIMVFALVQVNVAFEFPAAQFIYGRF